jgi:hypothetical protein
MYGGGVSAIMVNYKTEYSQIAVADFSHNYVHAYSNEVGFRQHQIFFTTASTFTEGKGSPIRVASGTGSSLRKPAGLCCVFRR